jgi:2-oxoglutarate/2-oxoacid ferredoxin oxidoreductase subunit beta
MKVIKNSKELKTKEMPTWCPGCTNYMVLESVKQTIERLIKQKRYRKEDFCMTTDIGCNSKIFDYLNISGIYGLHGRAIPNAIGIKIGNPNLNVLTFAGDGAVYAEGIEHFIHAFRSNPDLTLVLHDNQSFSLTTGQPTPTSQRGYISKAKPQGEESDPFNPVLLAIGAGAKFIARCNARDIKHTSEILEKAIKHKGFSFVELIQDCLIFNIEANNKDKIMYKIKDNDNEKKAIEYAKEYDYNSGEGKIPLGVIYKKKAKDLTDKWIQLSKLKKEKRCWADLR